MPLPSPERWRGLAPLIDRAVELPEEERRVFLDEVAAGDDRLRAELERLVRHFFSPDSPIDVPAHQRFAALLSGVVLQLPALLADRYRIDGLLGHGGMATVYLAQDVRHDRRVAVKILLPELSIGVRSRRFLAEIRTMAQLRHPHILPLYDSGEHDGLLFYVMPYVEGESLRERLRRETRIPFDEVLRISQDVASGLDSAHRHGIVHRDVKPENIMLDEDGAHLADFGIAEALNTASKANVEMPSGTPEYMSPEQAAGRDVTDGRSDVFSLGVTIYEMLSGTLPATGADGGDAPATFVTSGSAFPPDLPPSVHQVIAGALAHHPGERYETAGEFVRSLTLAGGGSGGGPPPDSARGLRVGSEAAIPSGGRRPVPGVVVATTLIGTVIGALVLYRSDSERPLAMSLPYGSHQTANVAAYDFYQRGLDQALSRSDSGARLAIQYFSKPSRLIPPTPLHMLSWRTCTSSRHWGPEPPTFPGARPSRGQRMRPSRRFHSTTRSRMPMRSSVSFGCLAPST